jgi:hypothetical protein
MLSFAACGKKGPPLPPGMRAPQPVSDLSALVREGAIELTWTNPTHRHDNSRVRDLVMARVYRSEDEGTGEPKPAVVSRGRVAGYTEVATVRLGVPGAPDTVMEGGGRVRLTDRSGLTYGRRYTYVVITEDGQGRVSPPSQRTSVKYIATPSAPTDVRVAAGDREVRLTWAAPPRPPEGAGPLVYEVLRAPSPESPAEPVTPAPIEAREFIDRNVENDRTYYYAVRALRREAATTARGEASSLVAATPAKSTPPAPPAELVAVPAVSTVRLIWKPSPDADVATYIVYRAGGSGLFARVGSTRPPSTVFVDRDVPRGSYRYVVTAESGAVRPLESARSNEVMVTVP